MLGLSNTIDNNIKNDNKANKIHSIERNSLDGDINKMIALKTNKLGKDNNEKNDKGKILY